MPDGSAPSLKGSVGSLLLAVLGINDRSEYNNMKDQSSTGRANWPLRKAQSLPLRAPRVRATKTNVLYVLAYKEAKSSGFNGASVNASTNPMSHVGRGEGFGGLLL